MSDWVKNNRLVAGIVTCHIALSAVNAHFLSINSKHERECLRVVKIFVRFLSFRYLVNHGNNLLFVIEVTVSSNAVDSSRYDGTYGWDGLNRCIWWSLRFRLVCLSQKIVTLFEFGYPLLALLLEWPKVGQMLNRQIISY